MRNRKQSYNFSTKTYVVGAQKNRLNGKNDGEENVYYFTLNFCEYFMVIKVIPGGLGCCPF